MICLLDVTSILRIFDYIYIIIGIYKPTLLTLGPQMVGPYAKILLTFISTLVRLSLAAERGHMPVVQELLSKQADGTCVTYRDMRFPHFQKLLFYSQIIHGLGTHKIQESPKIVKTICEMTRGDLFWIPVCTKLEIT